MAGSGPFVALVFVAALAGCAGAAAPAVQPAPAGMNPSDLAAIARAQADSARRPWTAADARFMTGMIHHHAQAVVMARMAESHGASPSVQALAARVINAQQDEIRTMQRWLADRRQPVPEPDPAGMRVEMDGHVHHELMPGMLSAGQLEQLDRARGPVFDWLFLSLMIQHHRGATVMVEELFRTDGAAQDETVFRFATDVHVDQTTEIARMEQMLEAMLVASAPSAPPESAHHDLFTTS